MSEIDKNCCRNIGDYLYSVKGVGVGEIASIVSYQKSAAIILDYQNHRMEEFQKISGLILILSQLGNIEI